MNQFSVKCLTVTYSELNGLTNCVATFTFNLESTPVPELPIPNPLSDSFTLTFKNLTEPTQYFPGNIYSVTFAEEVATESE